LARDRAGLARHRSLIRRLERMRVALEARAFGVERDL